MIYTERVAKLSFFLTLVAVALYGQRADGPFPGHKIAGNLYYVGSQQYSSYLITTPQGHILINSSFEETVPLIRASIESLGFKFSDVKILLNSHAHGDHVAGNFLVKELTGAKAYIMKGDEDLVANGGKGDFQYENSRFKPSKVDHVLHDGEEVKLGGSTLVAHHTPGHTKGNTTWTMVVEEDGKKLNAVIIGSPNVNPGYRLVNNARYPQIAEDYRKAFAVFKSLPCDLFLGAHGAYYGMDAKYALLKKRKPEDPNPFVDPAGYRKYIADKEQEFLQKLDEQRKQAAR